MAKTDKDAQKVRLEQYLLRGFRKDGSRKLFKMNRDSLIEVQCAADLGFGDLAIKHGNLYAIVESHCVLVSDLRSGERIREIVVPFEEELDGIALCPDGIFVWTLSEFYLIDESGDSHIKVGEFGCVVEPESRDPPEGSVGNAESDSQPTTKPSSRGLWMACVVRYDAEQKEFEAIIQYDDRDGVWRLLCKNGSQVKYEMIADGPWEKIGVRDDLTWLMRTQGDDRRVIAQRNGEIVHELNYIHKCCLWHGSLDEDALLYLRYCDFESNDFIDVIDTSGDSPKLLRKFSLGSEPGCAWFIPAISYEFAP